MTNCDGISQGRVTMNRTDNVETAGGLVNQEVLGEKNEWGNVLAHCSAHFDDLARLAPLADAC